MPFCSFPRRDLSKEAREAFEICPYKTIEDQERRFSFVQTFIQCPNVGKSVSNTDVETDRQRTEIAIRLGCDVCKYANNPPTESAAVWSQENSIQFR